MTNFVKIVCVGFCFVICNLRSETYNVITISRDVTGSYNRLATEEIYLVFTQLARCFPEVDISSLTPKDGWSTQAKAILGKPVAKIKNSAVPTIVVFNEAFFGKTEPLPKTEQKRSPESTSTPHEKKRKIDILDVDGIISIYEKFRPYMSDAYLYINFLYADSYTEENEKIYGPQIEISKNRYKEIEQNERQRFPSVYFSTFNEFIYNGWNGPKKDPNNTRLLFNQTKIFHTSNGDGREIGYYNKSSYCDEYEDILASNSYYVMGNFVTNYSGRRSPQIGCLTCYDIDVISNPMYKPQMPSSPICAFPSNTTTSLWEVVKENTEFQNTIFICSDGHFIDATDPDGAKRLSGVYKYEGSSLKLADESGSFFFEYQRSGFDSIKDVFTFKLFTLTTDESIVTMRP